MSKEFSREIWPFHIIAGKIYSVIYRSKICEAYLEKLGDNLIILYPEYEKKQILRQYVSYKIMSVLLFVFVGIMLFLVYSFALRGDNSLSELERQNYWGEDEVAQVVAKTDFDESPIDVNISHREISEEEILERIEAEAARLPDLVLGDNKSLDEISYDLNLVTQIPDTQIDVYWELEENDVVREDGSVVLEKMRKEGTLVKFMATLCYENVVTTTEFYGNFVLPDMSDKEIFKLKLKEKIEDINEGTVSDSSLVLPKEVEGVSVEYEKNDNNHSGVVFCLLFVICVPLIFFSEDEKLKKKKSARQNQMLVDYPEIVNKLELYLGAGLTIQGAFEMIAGNYLKDRKNGVKRAAYEEIVYMYREVQGGVSFRNGIEHLSNRCQVQSYRKLCMLLLQNLRKGSNELVGLLRQEAIGAFEERKSIAKRLGEEAGTKMLIPMVIMLGIVLVILVVPAWMSFQL